MLLIYSCESDPPLSVEEQLEANQARITMDMDENLLLTVSVNNFQEKLKKAGENNEQLKNSLVEKQKEIENLANEFMQESINNGNLSSGSSPKFKCDPPNLSPFPPPQHTLVKCRTVVVGKSDGSSSKTVLH